ncbi:hypothetical protein H4582DRAFT_2089140 [Lactarius indigo]|nr:hypothetical protein H4582DRAFT_2089140 [Lactarius indigo]
MPALAHCPSKHFSSLSGGLGTVQTSASTELRPTIMPPCNVPSSPSELGAFVTEVYANLDASTKASTTREILTGGIVIPTASSPAISRHHDESVPFTASPSIVHNTTTSSIPKPDHTYMLPEDELLPHHDVKASIVIAKSRGTAAVKAEAADRISSLSSTPNPVPQAVPNPFRRPVHPALSAASSFKETSIPAPILGPDEV